MSDTPSPDSAVAPETAFDRAMKALLNPDLSAAHAKVREAWRLAARGQIGPAAQILQAFLHSHPNDAPGLYVQGDLARQTGRYLAAEPLFAQCVAADPEFRPGRFQYANTLLEIGKAELALTHAEALLRRDAANPVFRALKAMALELLGDYAAAVTLWRDILREPAPPDCWVRYGNALRVLGQRDEAAAAWRNAIAIDPSYGQAWWSLASLKRFSFGDADVAQMERQLARPRIADRSRIPLLFALGKAYADLKRYDKSFDCYARGNALRRLAIKHDPAFFTAYVARCRAVLTADFFRERAGAGCASRAPIFLVGMPRAGSTLIEQILASHSSIEGTREMFNLGAISRQIQLGLGKGVSGYPSILALLDRASVETLGERYLENARLHRKLMRPFFTDKMGSNFAHLGLLRLILPNAKVVDVRRHPMACCFSNFTQLYANGQDETYRLSDVGQLYRDYVALMAHFDRMLPGMVHRVIYENLVADPEREIRALLDYLELPFEQACLEFHRTERSVSTISSEQVRTPLYREAIDHWRHYEAWLGPLKAALGNVLEAYPHVPPFD